MYCLYTCNTIFWTSGILFKVDATDSYLEECVKAKRMLGTFSKFASIYSVKKYEAEITTYISTIKQLRGFGVKVYLLSPYDSCDTEVQVHTKIIMDADISASRMGLSPTLMECAMFLPEQMIYNWRVFKQTRSSVYENSSKHIMYKKHLKILKLAGCVGRVGDLCILKNLYSRGICNLKCKWHGQYDLFDMDINTTVFNTCSRIIKRLPVFEMARWGRYPSICNNSYPIRNNLVSYKCAGNRKIGYYVYRHQTNLELSRHS